jgi:hypothetical protein
MSDPDATKSFDLAQDTTKQVLTLSTAVVTITVAVLKDLARDAPADARTLLAISWGLFVLSIFGGVCTLLNLAGRVPGGPAPRDAGINAPAIRCFSIMQMLTFALAMAATVYFGVRAL